MKHHDFRSTMSKKLPEACELGGGGGTHMHKELMLYSILLMFSFPPRIFENQHLKRISILFIPLMLSFLELHHSTVMMRLGYTPTPLS